MSSTTRRRRRRTPAELAAEALQCAQAHADNWGGNGPPRRPGLGHTADCPDNGRPMTRSGRCRFCRAEALGRRDVAGIVQAPTVGQPVNQPVDGPAVVERACSRCYRPTTNAELCDRCPPGDTL